MSEPAEEKLARLTRERDEMATQASACAEEVDRVRVEIGAVQAENERLRIIIRDREWKRDLAEREVDQLSAALAESERKRVEAKAEAAEAIAQRDILIRANADLAASWVEDATPTQETSHVES